MRFFGVSVHQKPGAGVSFCRDEILHSIQKEAAGELEVLPKPLFHHAFDATNGFWFFCRNLLPHADKDRIPNGKNLTFENRSAILGKL